MIRLKISNGWRKCFVSIAVGKCLGGKSYVWWHCPQVFNDEWATSGGMTKRQLNDLEMEFLISLDWRLHVTPVEFEDMASNLERAVAKKQITARKWNGLTYTDLQVIPCHEYDVAVLNYELCMWFLLKDTSCSTLISIYKKFGIWTEPQTLFSNDDVII